ncbi:unnamed protein product, partial [marine sediment metagenome]
AKTFPHLLIKLNSVDKLDFALAFLFLAVGNYPDICKYAGIVEKLVGHGDYGFKPVMLYNPLADIAFT